jgi:hypothetical protein
MIDQRRDPAETRVDPSGAAALDGLGWLASVERVEPDAAAEVGSNRIDFLLGASLAGLNLFVSAGLVLAWSLQTAGIFVVLFLGQDPGHIESPTALAFVVAGCLLGLAVGVGGFAAFTWKRWTSYYWPLFGMAIALLSSVVAARL